MGELSKDGKFVYPATSTRFDVTIPGISEDDVLASFYYCSGFSMKGSSIGGRFGDDNAMGGFVIPIGIEYSTITLKKGVIQDDRLFNYFTRAQNNYKPVDGSSILAGNDKDIILTVYNGNDKVKDRVVQWIFHNCGNASYKLEEFDASKPSYLTESFTFKFWGFERKSNFAAPQGNS